MTGRRNAHVSNVDEQAEQIADLIRRMTGVEARQGGRPVGSSTAGANIIINGAMEVAQRGTSFALASGVAAYTLDRWQALRAASGSTISQNNTAAAPFLYELRIQRDSGNTSAASITVAQSIESSACRRFKGQRATLSFTGRAGADLSSSNDAVRVVVTAAFGQDENHLTGSPSGLIALVDTPIVLTAASVRNSVSFDVPANIEQLCVQFIHAPSGTAGTNDWVGLTGVQLETSAGATSFEFLDRSVDVGRCRRFFRRYGGEVANATWGVGFSRTTNTTSKVVVQLGSAMRALPTIANAGAHQVIGSNDVQANVTAVTLQTAQTTRERVVANLTHASVTTAGIPVLWRSTDTTGLLDVTAEI